ncbi:hypothetical protein M3Y97_00353800 [Aphelenchoides bicaudatus]|nr:hypothetical protein M3Y97_00353800 [Aphelenchoides bicaudatus]
MDFDPDSEKWQFCCCRILTGLKLWTAVEIVGSLIFTVAMVSTCYTNVKAHESDTELIFDFGLLTICVLMLIGSILLMIGMLVYQEKLMYFTLFVRVCLVIFMSAFGVSRFVLSHNDTVNLNKQQTKRRRGPFENEKGETSTAIRLLFLIFFMVIVSASVFFTIYLVVRGIRFVAAYKKLQNRRQSLILASQIDPELVEHLRRKSHASNN